MQNDVIVGGIAMMAVRVPIPGMNMNFDIALQEFVCHTQGRPPEIRAAVAIVLPGIDDFNVLPLDCMQKLAWNFLLQPKVVKLRFRHCDIAPHDPLTKLTFTRYTLHV